MRSTRFGLLLFVLVVVLSPDLFAQVANYPPVPPYSSLLVRPPTRDPQALEVLQTAITAMGGAALIGQIQSWQLQGQLQHTTTNGNEEGTFSWEAAGTEFRIQTVTPSGTNVIVTGHGTPGVVSAGKSQAMPAHVVRAMFVPALIGSVLLKEFQDPNCSVESQNDTTLGSESVKVVTTTVRSSQMEAMVTPQTWYFDSNSGLPVRVEYRLPGMVGPRLYVASAHDFSNFQNVGGALYPFQIVTSRRGKQSDVVNLQSVIPNATISPDDFNAMPTQPGGVQ